MDPKGLGSACLRYSVREWGFETKREKKRKRESAREIKTLVAARYKMLLYASVSAVQNATHLAGESEDDGQNRVRMR